MRLDVLNTILLSCERCGDGESLHLKGVREGFLDSGWRVEYLTPETPVFVCRPCSDGQSPTRLERRREYLKHMFEAQQRFGE